MAALAALLSLTSCKPTEVKKDVKIIAHRGYWDREGSAQNSRSSLRNAMEAEVFGTEFDVYVTADGIPVLFHDTQTANGIVIEDATYAELRENAPLLPNGETIPTLREFFNTWDHDSVKLILEIKSASTPEKETFFVDRILQSVIGHGIAPEEIEYIAFSAHICNELKRLSPSATVSYLSGDKSPEEVAAAGWSGIDYHYGVFALYPDWVRQAHDLGLTVNVWTVNDEAVMRAMAALGVDYITTDKPLLLRKALDTAAK